MVDSPFSIFFFISYPCASTSRKYCAICRSCSAVSGGNRASRSALLQLAKLLASSKRAYPSRCCRSVSATMRRREKPKYATYTNNVDWAKVDWRREISCERKFCLEELSNPHQAKNSIVAHFGETCVSKSLSLAHAHDDAYLFLSPCSSSETTQRPAVTYRRTLTIEPPTTTPDMKPHARRCSLDKRLQAAKAMVCLYVLCVLRNILVVSMTAKRGWL